MRAALEEVRDEKGGALIASYRVVVDLGLVGILRDEEGNEATRDRISAGADRSCSGYHLYLQWKVKPLCLLLPAGFRYCTPRHQVLSTA